ncbi:uncharacterized protein LOC128350022 isoform X1 [Hemicordylus capensis]|uniref:uncharacterized protein LOC128350022 isoform X1 n=1 Tax=Hemicordylus capensis TaxID=884348 RepID=UPI0023022E0D|nr:uncharacterized protein LOC128350022 isoform X1 [Hemicordylus capensis]XP_053163492.1 uncharacterized protein LOC128350022 isoform X1 [Hemicordylus capensis]XP_053163493.1 uncharacterized protein LOC128350022 isoform X1 [Hemicordylus capensis]XP_053163494.1 uncharacterized protein LOC128350022 isoform X1 [Hemicordylus capensis]XP_053163495.1 uncharacterized protein LOC128350022 isoform X1 [Hemicordylus capensis]XP_053163496.1 uncharacterized protein LOC128350022 isoform X1 [Hemicordylus cap
MMSTSFTFTEDNFLGASDCPLLEAECWAICIFGLIQQDTSEVLMPLYLVSHCGVLKPEDADAEMFLESVATQWSCECPEAKLHSKEASKPLQNKSHPLQRIQKPQRWVVNRLLNTYMVEESSSAEAPSPYPHMESPLPNQVLLLAYSAYGIPTAQSGASACKLSQSPPSHHVATHGLSWRTANRLFPTTSPRMARFGEIII